MPINKIRSIKALFLVLLIFYLLDCGKNQKIYRLAAASLGTSYYSVGKNIADVVSSQSHIKLEAMTEPVAINGDTLPLNAQNNCHILSAGMADFAISQNDISLIPFANKNMNEFSNLQSIIPLYPEILFIFYKEPLKPTHNSLAGLIRGRKISMGPEGSGEARLTKKVFQEFGIQPNEYQARHVRFEENVLSDSIDICCMVTGFNNPRVQQSLQRGGNIFSLGDPDLAGKGSAADGFCLKYPLAKPIIIPKNIYSNLPEEPILTVAIDAILLTRDNMDDDVVYDVVETILNRKQYLVMDLDNKLLSQLTEQFDPLKLRFPLHKGAKHYLERNKPSFFERYAELFGVIFSILIALVGAITAITRWNKRRQKNRIDKYYRGVMDIQLQVDNLKTVQDCQNAIQGLKLLRRNAFEQLISEKLLADESFRIFITFMNDTRKEINLRWQEISGHR